MNRFVLVLSSALLLSACSMFPFRSAAPLVATAHSEVGKVPAPVPAATDVEIQRVPFRTGISSATVETLAKRKSCTGGAGAGLMTPPGPVEVYRMVCDNGKVFMAKCELRQCKPM